jgi:hypothetical protein
VVIKGGAFSERPTTYTPPTFIKCLVAVNSELKNIKLFHCGQLMA